MFDIEIILLEPSVKKAHFSSMNIDDIYKYLSVEGHLTIRQDNRIILSEDVAAIEFYWYVLKWYRAESIKRRVSFKYTTVEYVEPIMTFSYYQDQLWNIDSPWIKTPSFLVIEEHELEAQVKKLICYLAENLEIEHDSQFH